MTQFTNEYTFETKPIPQMEGVGGAHWENLPLASFPPAFDISIPDSFGAALSTAISNVAATFTGMSNTLTTMTQDLQNAACSIGSLVDSLKAAQKMAEDFAKENNSTKIFIRPIGLQPPGTITSQRIFLNSMRAAINDQGTSVGQIPKVVPAEIPLDPKAIADALGSGGNLAEQFLQGGKLSLGPVSASFGAGLRKLSNDEDFKNGFKVSSVVVPILSIMRESKTSPEIKITLQNGSPIPNPNDLVGKKITIKNAPSSNNGNFSITGFSDGSATQKLGGALGKLQSGISKLQKALSPFTIKINNEKGSQQSKAGGELTIDTGGITVSAAVKIRTSLTSRGFLQPNTRKTMPVTQLVDILIQDKIIGVSPSVEDGSGGEALELDALKKERDIAIERLARLTSSSNKKVGGIVLVGQAPDLPALAAKVAALSEMMAFLKPLATQLIQATADQAKKAALTPTGVYFDPALVDLAKLDSSKNIGKQDAQAASKKAKDSGVLEFTMPQLVSLAQSNPQPAPSNFNAWRTYSPSDLFPLLGDVFGLETFQTDLDGGANAFTSNVATATGALFASTFGTISQMVESGKNAVTDGLNTLQNKSKSIDGVVSELNKLNDQMTAGINFLKSQLGKGPLKIDGHLVGAKLDLLSNAEFADAVEACIRDVGDPNRPTFGPPASNSVLDNQSNIISTTQGLSPPKRANRLWFGILIFIVGDGREDLGRQMRTMTNLLGMDDAAIDLPPKPKLSLKF